ncbi:MAG: hypothetical protein ACRECO_05235 [Xanthobacteraceae bacterium]
MLPRLIASAVLAVGVMHGTALAQGQSSTAAPAETQAKSDLSLPQEIKQKLEKQGFSNVQIVPGSYIVSAKDKDGDPITAIIGPHSMTVFTMSTPGDSDSTTGSGSQSKKGGMGKK